MPPRPHPFVPFRLFCSTAVSKGMADDDPCKQFFVTLREAIGFDDGDGSGRNDRGCFVNDDKDGNSLGNRAFHWLVITSFLLDVEYLFEELPEIIKYQKVIVYYGSVEGNSMQAMRQWEQVLGNSGKTVEFIRLVPSGSCWSIRDILLINLNVLQKFRSPVFRYQSFALQTTLWSAPQQVLSERVRGGRKTHVSHWDPLCKFETIRYREENARHLRAGFSGQSPEEASCRRCQSIQTCQSRRGR